MKDLLSITSVYETLARHSAELRSAVRNRDESAALDCLVQQVKGGADHWESLRILGSDPLLFNLLCRVAQEDGADPDPSLGVLLERCTVVLLERSKPSDAGLSELYSLLSARQKSLFLEGLAGWMLVHSLIEVPLEALDTQLETLISTLVRPPKDMTAQSLRQLFVRIGVLYESVEGRIAFASPHLQSFFAARDLRNREQIETLVSHADADPWQEVILLVLECASLREADSILAGLLARIGETTSLYDLIFYGLKAPIEVSPQVYGEVNQWLQSAGGERV